MIIRIWNISCPINFWIAGKYGSPNSCLNSISKSFINQVQWTTKLTLSPVAQGTFLKKNRRQFQWQTVLKKENFRIQQLILAVNDNEFFPITINDEFGRWTSNGSSFPTPFDSGNCDEFPITINDAIGNAYAENERTQKKINALNTNQRTLKKFLLSETNVTDGRIFFKDKLFVPDVGQLKFRFIKKSHDDPAAKHPGKTKTYEILSRYYYWFGIINDVKRFVKNCYGCRRNKNFAINTTEFWSLFPSQINDVLTFRSISSLIGQ